MNREIKFRVWDIPHQVMGSVTWIDFRNEEVDYSGHISEPLKFDQVKLMQFTGLKDKNGKEIYEGDVLKYTAHNGYMMFPGRLTIKWIERSACFGYSHSDQSFTPNYVSPFTEHDELQDDVLNYCEIIGNIHEHPNLLTNGK